MSKKDAEAKLGVSLGAPEDFPWFKVHQTLYYYHNGGQTYFLLFNDSDQLDMIYIDEAKGFDNSVFERYKAMYGEPTLDDDNYVFDLGSGSVVEVYNEEYRETGEVYFRQVYRDNNYYH